MRIFFVSLVTGSDLIFSLPGQSPGRAIILPPALALAVSALAKC